MTETPLAATPSTDTPTGATGRRPFRERHRRAIVRLAVVTPIIVAGVRAAVTGWFPVGDSALLAVRAADVGTADHPWLGSWTSASLAVGENVNNPGPLYHDLIAPFMSTIGRAWSYGAAVAIGVAVVNVAFALMAMWFADRIGGWRMERWIALAVAALSWAMGSALLIDIWQPHALLLPLLCFLVVSVGVLGAVWRLLPWWVALASLLVQTHVASLYITAALGVAIAAVGATRLRAHARREGILLGAAIADTVRTGPALGVAIVAALAWIQPIVEQVSGPGTGNLQRLAGAAGGGDLTVGAATATKIVAAVTALWPWWGRWGWEDSVRSTPVTQTAAGPQLLVEGLPSGVVAAVALAVVFGALAALVVMLRAPAQRHARAAAAVAAIGLVVALGGIATQTVTATGLGNHQVRWIFGLAVFVHVAIAWGIAELVTAHRLAKRTLQPVLFGVVAVLAVANLPAYAHDLGPTADRAAADTLELTFDDLAGFDPPGPILYDTANVRVFEPYSGAVQMRLRELGVPFRFTAEIDVRQFGEHRRADGSSDGGTVGTLRQHERVDAIRFEGDGCTLSMRSGVPPDEEARVDAIVEAAAADLVGAPIDVTGLPDDVAALASGATTGDERSAHELVALAIVPVLVAEGRVTSTPAIDAAVADTDAIVARVNTALRITVTPATLC
jgi:hypothetical protein